MRKSGLIPSIAVAAALCAVAPLLRAEAPPDLSALPPAAAAQVDFVRDIQPLFAAHCISCHGPEKQKGGLRLDVKDLALKGSDEGPIAVSGDSAQSKVIHLVSGLNPEETMPPKGERLSPGQVGLLRAWIDQGMAWPDEASATQAPANSEHWAFNTPQRPALPPVERADWVANPVDAFVAAKLEAEGVEPSPEAAPETLLRRLYLDLVGLPPSPEEVDQYLADPDPHRYERLVNRLLASTHFGERWGRHWLDTARYADSDGYEKDTGRPYAYRYRDWVIEALNRDLPYDQFTIEQLAGDLLPNPTLDQLLATGFHRNTLTNREGGIDPEEDRTKIAVDRVSTTATVFMGLTMACAQCHSHKYDPISQREFYQMYAFFNTTLEKDVPAVSPAELAAYEQTKKQFDLQTAENTRKIEEYRPTLEEKAAAWEATLTVPPLPWHVIEPTGFLSAGGATFKQLEDASLLVTGAQPDQEMYTVAGWTSALHVKAVRLQTLTHPELAKNGPGRASNGNFVLAEFRAYAAPLHKPYDRKELKIVSAKADYEETAYPAQHAIDGNPRTAWGIFRDEQTNENRQVVFTLAEEAGFPEGTVFTFELEHHYGRQHNIGRMRFSVATEVSEEAPPFPDDVHTALLVPAARRSELQRNAVLDFFGRQDPYMGELLATRDVLNQTAPKPPQTMAPALVENEQPPKTFVHLRGDFLQPGDEVAAGGPAILPSMSIAHPDRPTRLDLARWLVSPEHPLTARVQVNRIWSYLFGQGLVPTPEDFGTQGDPPTHPELLDWLALEYQSRGWSTKDLIRLLTNSSTYKQSSHTRPELFDRDPYNHLLARQSRYHVEAEITRDLNLAVSGLLNAQVGGPSIRPPLPEGIAELGYADSIKWVADTGPEQYRRGLYIFFQRTVPYPMLIAFDCPDSNLTNVKRNRSNTPLQALTLLNGVVSFECAQALGGRILERPLEGDEARIRYLFKLCLGREAREPEVQRLLQFAAEQRSRFEQDPEAATRFAGRHQPDGANPIEAATYVALARTVTNVDEFLTRE